VEDFVAQDLLEDCARGRIVVHDVPIDLEPAGSGLFRDVQEGEQPMVRLAVDLEVVQPVAAGEWRSAEQAVGPGGKRLEECRAALAEHVAVAELIDRVLEIQSSQKRIGGDFGCPEDIASAVGFHFGEREELSDSPVQIAPHPPVHGSHHPVQIRCSHGDTSVSRSRMRLILEITVASIGGALVVLALAANQSWLDRHFLPSFFLPRRWYVIVEAVVRVMLAIIGVWLAVVLRPRIGRLVTGTRIRAVPIAIAALLAIGAGELVLRTTRMRPVGWLVPEEEPRRRLDPRLGWTLVPNRTARSRIGGRVVEYAIDPAGYRVRRVDEPVDPERPTILFTGESVMFGEGLTWDESISGRVAALTGIQSANLAVHGFGNDQAYLRLAMELPRFRQPVAVVSLFMTALFGRNLDRERPHLGPGLTWLPAEPRSRLASLAILLVPYRSDDTVDRGIAMTREVLGATIDVARARGAMPLIVVPQFGPDDELERSLRRRVLDEAHLPYLLVETDATWRVPGDLHPNALAARVIAEAIAARLR
jgi:hypothetical protein